MRDSIRRLVAWARAVLASGPARGRHRAVPGTARPVPPPPPGVPASVACGFEPLDGEEHALVRPYLVAWEEAQLQWQRRRALLLALDGIDVGPRWIHEVEVAR